jgi:hypothetical protein
VFYATAERIRWNSECFIGHCVTTTTKQLLLPLQKFAGVPVRNADICLCYKGKEMTIDFHLAYLQTKQFQIWKKCDCTCFVLCVVLFCSPSFFLFLCFFLFCSSLFYLSLLSSLCLYSLFSCFVSTFLCFSAEHGDTGSLARTGRHISRFASTGCQEPAFDPIMPLACPSHAPTQAATLTPSNIQSGVKFMTANKKSVVAFKIMCSTNWFYNQQIKKKNYHNCPRSG